MTPIDERAQDAARAAWLESMSDYTGLDKAIRAAITAYLQALRPGSTGETEGWQPIETFDGSEAYVLVFDGSYVSEARYQPSEKGWWLANMHPTDAYDGQVYPTHWRPLPDPPSVMLAAAGGREG